MMHVVVRGAAGDVEAHRRGQPALTGGNIPRVDVPAPRLVAEIQVQPVNVCDPALMTLTAMPGMSDGPSLEMPVSVIVIVG